MNKQLTEVLSFFEGAVRPLQSTVPGLSWDTERLEGGYLLNLKHKESGKTVFSSLGSVVEEDDLLTSVNTLDKVFKDTKVDWTKPLDAVNAGVVASAWKRAKAMEHPKLNRKMTLTTRVVEYKD